MDAAFDLLRYAKTVLVPRLEEMLVLSQAFGPPEQVGFFTIIRDQIAKANDPADVAEAFLHLSSAAFLGFDYEPEQSELLHEILELAETLSETLSVQDRDRH